MSFSQLFSLALSAILVQNFVLVKFLGICPFLGASKKMNTALGMGLSVTFVMGLASMLTWVVNTCLLLKLDLGYMQTVTYILIIAALVQFVELFLKKKVPALYQALGIYLPLITTNCAVLGVALLNARNGYGFLESTAYGVFSGLGFTLAIILFSSIRERMEFSECPKAFQGMPVVLMTAGLLALAFMGFSGLQIG
jgi:electron transport complex protein RnfA